MAALSTWSPLTLLSVILGYAIIAVALTEASFVTTPRWRATWLVLLLVATTTIPARGQAPRRDLQMGFSRDSVGRVATGDSINRSAFRPQLRPVAQDTSRQCRTTRGYVLFGGFIGLLVGSARYEKETQHGDFAPFFTIPHWS